LDAAVVVTDLAGLILYWNAAAEQLYGYRRSRMLGSNVSELLVGPDNQAAGEAIMSLVVSGQQWSGEFPVLCANGVTRQVRVTDSPLWHDGVVVGVVGIGVDVSDPAAGDADAAVLAGRLDRLSRAIAELAGARTVGEVTEIVISHAAAAVGAGVASLSLLDENDMLRLEGVSGAQPDTSRRWRSHPLAADLPASEALRTRAPVMIAGTAAIESRYPLLAGQLPGERSVVCLPLLSAGRPVGAIGLVFLGLRLPDPRELSFLSTLADACAQVLERIQAQQQAADRSAKLEFLAEASAELAASLDYRTTLANLARLAVPRLADWCAVEIVEDGRLHTLAVAHVDPAKVALAEELQLRYPSDAESPTGSPNVVRTGVSELYEAITDELLVAGARDEEHLQISRALDLRSAVVVALTVQNRIIGAVTMIFAESGRRYRADDVSFAEELARRAGVAVDNAQLHTQTLEVATRLQQAIVPHRLPAVDGYELAFDYRAAGRTDVGGDLYDAIPLADGRVAVVIGDVMGRGVTAAAAMAQMRAAIRAYIAIDPDPAAVMTHLDGMFTSYDMNQLVTLVYMLADGDRVALVNAGHPPPLTISADGQARLLPLADSVPLGAGPDDRIVHHVALPAGTTLLGYTDGLIERRGEDITAGLDRLIRHSNLLHDQPLAAGLQHLFDALHDDRRDDDVTAIAIRRRHRQPKNRSGAG